MKFFYQVICTVLFTFFTTGIALANPVLTDLPVDTYVTKDSLDWAWASPVNEELFGGNILSDPSLHSGWRFATTEELLNIPTLADFGNGSIQSVIYWNTIFTHVDASDLQGGFFSSNWGNGVNETFYVRDVANPSSVPLPAALPLMLSAIGIFGISRHKSKI